MKTFAKIIVVDDEQYLVMMDTYENQPCVKIMFLEPNPDAKEGGHWLMMEVIVIPDINSRHTYFTEVDAKRVVTSRVHALEHKTQNMNKGNGDGPEIIGYTTEEWRPPQ